MTKPVTRSTQICPSVRDQLEALEDNELEPRPRARVMRHLAACDECRAARSKAASALGAARSALAQHPRIAAPQGFDARVWQSIEARRRERERASTSMARLGMFLLRPIPRLLSSAMFGLLAALAFGRVAASTSASAGSSGLPQAAIALPMGASYPPDEEAALADLYAMEQGRMRPPGHTQVLVPAPQPARMPASKPERRSLENFLWPNPPRPSHDTSSSAAGSWC